MITIHDLLEDKTFKQFICTVPTFEARTDLPWRLMVQLKGEHHFRMKRFDSYTDAFKGMKKMLPKAADATINCPAVQFDAPMRVVRIKGKYFTKPDGTREQQSKLITWAPKVPSGEYDDHNWCGYCRRPTVFRRFRSHPILAPKTIGGLPIDPNLLRCTICGASENIVRLKRR